MVIESSSHDFRLAAYQRFDNGPAHRSQSHFAANDTRSETHCRRI